MFGAPDFDAMFAPSVSLFELVLRGSIMYLVIFTLLRVVRREAGSITVADVLVLVLIADAAQNGMAAEYTSITEGAVLVATIIFWSVAVDWLSYNFEFIGRMVHPKPIDLVQDGVPNRKHLRNNMITMDELMTAVRQAGGEELSQVKSALLEGNGEVSVVLREGT